LSRITPLITPPCICAGYPEHFAAFVPGLCIFAWHVRPLGLVGRSMAWTLQLHMHRILRRLGDLA
jgi:hypothetical protein